MVASPVAKEKPKVPPARDDDANVTTVKVYRRFARMVSQLGSLLDIPQQDVLDRYAQKIEEDLLTELARRQAEIRGSRKD